MRSRPRRDLASLAMPSTVQHVPHGTFGDDPFGRGAERVARFFGTPRYILVQTGLVILWIALNSLALISHWDPYTELTQQDKELTQQVADLTREIHALLMKSG